MRYISKLTVIVALFFSVPAHAEFEWVSYTWDNDLFVGDDNGYTNGLYVALYDIEGNSSKPTPSWILEPLRWSLTEEESSIAVNSYTLGQAMVTPEDIKAVFPVPLDLPYVGLLYFNNTYLTINDNHADKIGATLGVVGPLSIAEQSQKLIHRIVGANEPAGWDSQLDNELVFQIDRARAWHTWVSDNHDWDLVTTAELSIGTISSSISTGIMIRYGTDLRKSYGTALLVSSRISNPLSTEGNWNIYGSLNAGYLFNQIFTDGNTFKDSHSVDYEHERIGASIGFSFSWDGYSITCAITDLNILKKEKLEHLTQFGSLTIAVRL